MLGEGLTPAQAQEPASQSLLIHNVLAAHIKDFALERPLLEVACKVFIKAGIPETLIADTIEAFLRNYLPAARKN